MPKRFKAIGFDYGGVIEGMPGSLFNEKLRELIGITKEQHREVYYRLNEKINKGAVTWPEFWTEYLTSFDKTHLLDEVLALSQSFYATGIHAGVLNLVDELRGHGYKVGILSNNTVDMSGRIAREGIAQHFDVVHVSAVTGHMKPEAESFRGFAAALGVELNELVYTDDSAKSLSTASELGYEPILYKDLQQLRTRLAELGVL